MPTELEEIEAKLKLLRDEAKALYEKQAPIQERLRELGKACEPLTERAGELRALAMGADPDWKSIIKDLTGCTGKSSVALLRYAERFLRDRYDMYHSGYWQDTVEANIEVKIGRNDPKSLRKNTEGVKLFLPLMTPHSDGYVWFGIFEESGNSTLKIKPDASVSFIEHRYRKSEEFSTVEAALEYIQKHHSYGGLPDEEDDED